MTGKILLRKTKSVYKRIRNYILSYVSPKSLADVLYTDTMGKNKKINWRNPKDLNEKINWLKFNSDTSQWTILADKYRVREFVKKRIGEEYLIPLLGVWNTPDEIDFKVLPESFVLKTNGGAVSVIVVRDKNDIDENEIRSKLRNWLKTDFGRIHAEPHYRGIPPKIIAEVLIEDDKTLSSSLIDYKIWCFNGKVFGTWCTFNRIYFHADTEWHDIEWRYRPEWSVFSESYKKGGGNLPKPVNYEKMLSVASQLSKNFPQVRVDLYNIKGKIYFGEMTFTSAGGHMNFYSEEVLDKMGEMTDLFINP